MKHILWHSPYYNIFLNNFQSINQIGKVNLVSNFIFSYGVYKKKVILNYYSLVFNLFLNIMDIKDDWSYILTLDDDHKEILALSYYSFYYYFYYGNFFFNNLNFIDLYRIFISLFFKYYNSFLFTLTRYNYVLKYKNYTLKYFFLRYFNIKSYIKNIYIRFRIQVYR
jgi:hypothetical protein